jgi:hypothetical protein
MALPFQACWYNTAMPAEATTKPSAASVDEHIAAMPDAARAADCRALVQLMRKLTKQDPVMWGPTIVGFDSYHYRYESGREGDACLMGFASRGSDIAIYVVAGFEGAESLLADLGKYKASRACLYIKRLVDIKLEVLEALLAHSASAMRRRYPAEPTSVTQVAADPAGSQGGCGSAAA